MGYKVGCFSDAGFLYAASYQDDHLYNLASEVLGKRNTQLVRRA